MHVEDSKLRPNLPSSPGLSSPAVSSAPVVIAEVNPMDLAVAFGEGCTRGLAGGEDVLGQDDLLRLPVLMDAFLTGAAVDGCCFRCWRLFGGMRGCVGSRRYH